MYFKCALFLNTLRSVVNDDARWWKLVRDTFERFKYQNIMTEDVVRFFNAELKQDLTPVFDQYLRRAELPTLELTFDEKAATVAYRWKADERALRDADSRRLARRVADDQADDGVAGDAEQVGEGQVRGRDRPLLRERVDPRSQRASLQ